MATALAVVFALMAACCFALGSLVQQRAAREAGQRALDPRLLVQLARRPRWLGGVGLNAFSFGLQGVALAFGPLTLVQPLAATDVLFALPLIARRHRHPLSWREVAGVLAVTGGIVAFLATLPHNHSTRVPGALAWAPVFLAVGALAALTAVISARVRGRARVAWLAVAAGAVYGLVDALAKSTVGIMARQGLGVVTHWEPYVLIAAALLGALFGQSAFGAGALVVSLPVIDTLEPVSAVIIGATVFGERLASSAPGLTVQLAGAVVAITGIAVLSRSAIAEAETREKRAVWVGNRAAARDVQTVANPPEE